MRESITDIVSCFFYSPAIQVLGKQFYGPPLTLYLCDNAARFDLQWAIGGGGSSSSSSSSSSSPLSQSPWWPDMSSCRWGNCQRPISHGSGRWRTRLTRWAFCWLEKLVISTSLKLLGTFAIVSVYMVSTSMPFMVVSNVVGYLLKRGWGWIKAGQGWAFNFTAYLPTSLLLMKFVSLPELAG